MVEWGPGEGKGSGGFALTQSAYGVVDVAGWAGSVHVDRPHNKLILRFRQQALQNHGVGLDGLADIGPLRVHLWPVNDRGAGQDSFSAAEYVT